jgi:hypothetical protein
MKRKTAFALATVLAIAAFGTGCSSGSTGSKANKGALAVSMGATGAMPAVQGGVSADHKGGPTAATVTISSASARQIDGTWINIDGTFPMKVDLIALAANGNAVDLPADLVPEGQYNALQFTITAVNLTLEGGTTVAITPPGTGWVVLVPVDFTVTAGKETSVKLRFRVDGSFKSLNGEFEFDPEVEVEGVEHHD